MAVPPFFPRVEPEFCALPAPAPQLRACIIVPARDEAEGIASALDALAAQSEVEARAFEIVLLCNNCRDNTALIARAWRRAHPHITLHVIEKELRGAQACIGEARAMLMDAAYFRLQNVSRARGPRAICSTDADSRVEARWLATTLDELDGGAPAVGGRILVESAPDDAPALRRLYLQDTVYRLLWARLEARMAPESCDAWPRHFQFFGASMALRPETYAHVGGLPRVNCLEDMALKRALLRADVPIRHSPRVRVRTSARRVGRVECGLSTQLAEWQSLDSNGWRVASGAELAHGFRLRQRARHLFCALATPRQQAQLARELFLPVAQVEAAFASAPTFGALWDELWSAAENSEIWRKRWPHVEIGAAIAQLREILARDDVR